MTQIPPIAPMPPAPGVKPHRGTTILVLGILSLFISCGGIGLVLGIIAIVMGNGDLREMRAGRMDPTGQDMTNAGKICGIVSVVIGGIGMLIGILWVCFVLFMAAGVASGAGGIGHP